MEINIAKTSGFCFGVNRAVKIVDELLSKGEKVYTLGPIIHNPIVTENFKKRGAEIIEASLFIPQDAILVIRSHGVTKSKLEYIKFKNIKYIDATCPFVKKIHNIVTKESKDKNTVLLAAGDEKHPEMVGIRSYFDGKSYVFKNIFELKNLYEIIQNSCYKKIIMVAQTTFSIEEWKKCIIFSKKVFTNIKIFDTICNTTDSRQKEADFLSKKSDLMIVIGGKNSSNTRKLYKICNNNTETIWVESVCNLVGKNFSKYEKISIVAGASTPMEVINEIYKYIKSTVESVDCNLS